LDQPANAEERIMKAIVVLSLAMFFHPMLISSQDTTNGNKPNDLHHERINITGCLSKNSLNEFELVDQGNDYLPYSAVVHLNKYVGKTVTLTGLVGAMPSADSGVHKPHFQVSKVKLVSDQCKQ